MTLTQLVLLINAILELNLLLFFLDDLLLLLFVFDLSLLAHRFELVIELLLLLAEEISLILCLLDLLLTFCLSFFDISLSIIAFGFLFR